MLLAKDMKPVQTMHIFLAINVLTVYHDNDRLIAK